MAKSWRAGMIHPLGLLLLAASLVLVVASPLGVASDRRPWLALWGILAYVGVATTVALRPLVALVTETSLNLRARLESDTSDLTRLVEEALRHLRDPAALARCELGHRLPRSMLQARGLSRARSTAATPLEAARALRSVIESSLEELRLTPGDEPAALQYAILHAEYLLGLPNTAIMSRNSVSESTFHRIRRAGVQALTIELQAREASLASNSPK